MATALVTGGAGFIGSHVADELIAAGLDVVVLDDLSGGFWRNIPETAHFAPGSIEDHDRIEEVFAKYRFEYVFHLAAYAAEGLSHFIRRYNYQTNLIGSINLINAAVRHECKCFVFTSSVAVYGDGRPPFSEDDPTIPADPYGISKLAVEQDLRVASQMFGLNHVIFRPHNVYGERQNLSDPYRNVVGIFLNQVLRGEPCTIFGDGSQTRGFSHITEVAPLIAKSIGVPEALNETFNIGASESCSVSQLAHLIQESVGREVPIQHLPPRMESLHLASDHDKLRRVFGSRKRVELAEGIRRMSAWAKGITPKPLQPFTTIEITNNLPSSWKRLSGLDRS